MSNELDSFRHRVKKLSKTLPVNFMGNFIKDNPTFTPQQIRAAMSMTIYDSQLIEKIEKWICSKDLVK